MIFFRLKRRTIGFIPKEASSSEVNPSRIKSETLSSTGSVQQPAMHPLHIPALYFFQVLGLCESGFMDTLPMFQNLNLFNQGAWDITRIWISFTILLQTLELF
jgi:hypothetical protein